MVWNDPQTTSNTLEKKQPRASLREDAESGQRPPGVPVKALSTANMDVDPRISHSHPLPGDSFLDGYRHQHHSSLNSAL